MDNYNQEDHSGGYYNNDPRNYWSKTQDKNGSSQYRNQTWSYQSQQHYMTDNYGYQASESQQSSSCMPGNDGSQTMQSGQFSAGENDQSTTQSGYFSMRGDDYSTHEQQYSTEWHESPHSVESSKDDKFSNRKSFASDESTFTGRMQHNQGQNQLSHRGTSEKEFIDRNRFSNDYKRQHPDFHYSSEVPPKMQKLPEMYESGVDTSAEYTGNESSEWTYQDQRMYDGRSADQYRDPSSYGFQSMSRPHNQGIFHTSNTPMTSAFENRNERITNSQKSVEQTPFQGQNKFEKFSSVDAAARVPFVEATTDKQTQFSSPMTYPYPVKDQYRWSKSNTKNFRREGQNNYPKPYLNKKQASGGFSGYRTKNQNQVFKQGSQEITDSSSNFELKFVKPETTSEKIRRFSSCLLEIPPSLNSVTAFYNAKSKFDKSLTSEYLEDQISENGPLWTGCLRMEQQFICRSFELSKKKLKHSVFNKALEIMKTKNINEIMSLEDIGVEAIQTEFNHVLNTLNSLEAAVSKVAGPEVASNLFPSVMHTSKEKTTDVSNLMEAVNDGQLTFKQKKGFAKLQLFARQNLKIESPENADMVRLLQKSDCFLKGHNDNQCFFQEQEPQIFYRHVYSINKIPIGVAEDARQAVALKLSIEKAYKNILELPLEQLIEGVSVADNRELVSAPLGDNYQNLPLNEKFHKLIEFAKQSNFMDSQLIKCTEQVLNGMRLKMKLITETSQNIPPEKVCKFRLEHVFIASGIDIHKGTAKRKAYRNAWLALSSSTVSDLLGNKSGDTNLSVQQQIKEVAEREQKEKEAAQTSLEKFISDNNSKESIENRMENVYATLPTEKMFIIFRFCNKLMGSKKFALSILQYSAEMCDHKFLCYAMKNPDQNASKNTKFIGEIKLEDNIFAQAFGKSKKNAKDIAALKALKILARYSPEIEIVCDSEIEKDIWHTYDDIKKIAEYLGKLTSDGPLQACIDLIDRITDEQPLRQVVFAPDIPIGIQSSIIKYVKEKNDSLDFKNRYSEGQPYLLIFAKQQGIIILELLRELGYKKDFRYKLISNKGSGDVENNTELASDSEED